ncbi:hypothetical protein FDP41_010174 [Naegleria fowleri]|uniref:PH domain-containing protein n=1 Tax=Naegleria fowleri TaxID=5763 RepID=A0A6A5BC37_NAEFO|nr:uncharacterized protein FDP41_010174 [Naegleria fowleri]KAF0971568.1 hypothetical protein FDP41_010174 [Naegleria fowleri]
MQSSQKFTASSNLTIEDHHQEQHGTSVLSSSESSTSSSLSTMTPSMDQSHELIPEAPVADESLNVQQEIGEMTALEALDFLIEENKKLWKEKIKFENSNIAKMQIQTQQHEKEKQHLSLQVRKIKTKIIETKLDQKSLKSEAKFLSTKFSDEFSSLIETIKDNINMKMDQMDNELDKMEKQYNNVLKDSEDQVRETAGFLLKVGQTVKSWKRRWFVFRKDLTFSYFKTVEDLKPIDTIDVSMEESLDISADVTQGKPFAFKLVTKDRTYYLCATNEDEKRRWISTLRRWFEVNKAYLTK